MNRKVKKAVFPVAGFGTRFLPATKAMPKELLPIVDKPLIQYAVEEAIAAGIDTLIFVTGRNKRAIEDHFDVNKELELALRSKGKNEQADMVRNIIPPHVECIFVRQPEQLGLGHAVLCAERAVAGEPFAVLLADDFLTDYVPGVTADLVGAFEKTGNSQLSVMQVDEAYISQYGVIIPSSDGHGVLGVVEKPRQDEAPSNRASIGRYILTSDIFDLLRTLPAGSGGEIQLADALNLHAQGGLLEAIRLKGIRFDCGSVDGFMSASAHEYSKRLKN
ncbi:UTP--glucose-1-phosphate uridylyltransferase GalU [Amylibacter sp.]|nr:UTP--glucose-1-phosphate uridylyltransferase GalU [Amylibacter sp.]MDC1041474.1 UTP--glucose-1-phosphate uridylyltransferase GalU [Amylibacter sp.]